MPPQPASASSVSSQTVRVTAAVPVALLPRLPVAPPRSAWVAATASAKAAGVRSPGGVLTQSRVRDTAAATTSAVRSASTYSARRAPSHSTMTSLGRSAGSEVR